MLESGIDQLNENPESAENQFSFWTDYCKNPNPVQKMDRLPTQSFNNRIKTLDSLVSQQKISLQIELFLELIALI